LQNHDADTVQYILNRLTKQQLSDKIFKNDIQRKKYNELLNIYELLSVVGIERIRDIYEYFSHHILYSKKYEEEKIIQLICKIINHFNDYENLIMYSNVQLATISYTYNLTVTVYKFNDFNLDFYTNKFKQSDVSNFLEQQKLIQNKLEKTNSTNNHSQSSCSYL
jgi:lactam utilization protein B